MIEELPIGISDYYKWFHIRAKITIKKYKEKIQALENRIEELKAKVEKSTDFVNTHYHFNPYDYDEYQDNKYTDGTFLKAAKALFMNKKNQYQVVMELLDIYKLASFQKALKEDEDKLALEEKKYDLDYFKYRDILRVYYSQVHKEMIDNGNGYVMSGMLGCMLFNRFKLKGNRKAINFRETNKRKAEIKANGGKVWDRETYLWCKKYGIEYDAEDPRIYLTGDHAYELILINCRVTHGHSVKIFRTEYIGRNYKNMSYDEILATCKTKDDILNLPLDIAKKLTLYLKRYPQEYTKFIRNENQYIYKYAKACSEGR